MQDSEYNVKDKKQIQRNHERRLGGHARARLALGFVLAGEGGASTAMVGTGEESLLSPGSTARRLEARPRVTMRSTVTGSLARLSVSFSMSLAFRFFDWEAPTTVSEDSTDEDRLPLPTKVSADDWDVDRVWDEVDEAEDEEDGRGGESWPAPTTFLGEDPVDRMRIGEGECDLDFMSGSGRASAGVPSCAAVPRSMESSSGTDAGVGALRGTRLGDLRGFFLGGALDATCFFSGLSFLEPVHTMQVHPTSRPKNSLPLISACSPLLRVVRCFLSCFGSVGYHLWLICT